jgi:carbon-monoxide dehydrogenase medium subunit
MKPAPFQYFAPRELEEALDLLCQHGDEAKVLAGGQSLIPLMNLRLVRPRVIVDINRLVNLDTLSVGSSGQLVIGGLVRQRTVERSAVVKEYNPLLAATMPMIGHFQNRNRGTIAGSLVHADPAAELPAVFLALEASFVVQSVRGTRIIEAKDFFTGYLSTVICADEVLSEIRIPAMARNVGWAIEEVARRKGDFAVVGTVVLIQLDQKNRCQNASIVLFGVGEKPERMERAADLLRGKDLNRTDLLEAASIVSKDLDPITDVHGSAVYRREVGATLTRRALTKAFGRAKLQQHDF